MRFSTCYIIFKWFKRFFFFVWFFSKKVWIQTDTGFCVNLTSAGTITPWGGTWCSSVFTFWTEMHSGTLLTSLHDSVLALLHPIQQIQASLLVTGVRLELPMHKQTEVWRRTLKQGEEMAICFLKCKHFGLYFAPHFICVKQRLVRFSILRGVKNLT